MELFCSGILFDLPLPSHRFLFGAKGLLIDQADRPAGARVFGAGAGIVGLQAAGEIVGPAGIKGPVCTTQDISDVLFHRKSCVLGRNIIHCTSGGRDPPYRV